MDAMEDAIKDLMRILDSDEIGSTQRYGNIDSHGVDEEQNRGRLKHIRYELTAFIRLTDLPKK